MSKSYSCRHVLLALALVNDVKDVVATWSMALFREQGTYNYILKGWVGPLWLEASAEPHISSLCTDSLIEE
jgi:hypothetical protein